jgi:hypothetical protein
MAGEGNEELILGDRGSPGAPTSLNPLGCGRRMAREARYRSPRRAGRTCNLSLLSTLLADTHKLGHYGVMRRIPRRLAALALLALVAAGLFWLGLYLRGKGILWASEFGTIGALFVAIVALFIPVLGHWLRGPAPMSQVGVVQAGDDLATSLGEQWAGEDRLRRINDPRPLPVRWDVTPTAQAAMAGVPHEEDSWADLAGKFTDIRATFERIQWRRLVILGAAGAGKSVLVVKLARELLVVRSSGMPIPVILPAATWNPDISLAEWISEQLESDHPGLALRVKTVTGEVTSLAEALATRSILPILDGLDELPWKLRNKVISEINSLGSDFPLVITSRPNEYLDAIKSAGRAISRAMVVELLPLRVQEVREYLTEATPVAPPGRWDRVFERLDSAPKGPLTEVLTTPLMLWLARTVYENTEDDPSELTTNNFKTQESIEHHLLDAFLPAVYARRSERSKFNCAPSQAQRWLRFIATYLAKTGSPNLAWWRLTSITRVWRPLGVGIRFTLSIIVAWTLTVALLKRHGYWEHGAYNSHGHLSDFILSGPLGKGIRPMVDQWLAVIQQSASVHHSVDIGLTPIRWFSWGSLPVLALRIGLVATLLGVFSMIADRPIPPKVIRFKSLRPIGRLILTLLLFLANVAILILMALHYSPTVSAAKAVLHTHSGHLLLLFFLLYTVLSSSPSFSAQVEETRATSPAKVLRLDRHASLLTLLVANVPFALLLFLYAGWEITLIFCVWFVTLILVRFTLGGISSASWLFNDARAWLSCGRLLPWRSMAFLADAHQRGILRQVGAEYQFRHIRLQERLSSPIPASFVGTLIIKASLSIDHHTLNHGKNVLGEEKVSSSWQLRLTPWGILQFRRVGTTLVYRDPRFDQPTNLHRTEDDGDLPGTTGNQELSRHSHALALPADCGWRARPTAASSPRRSSTPPGGKPSQTVASGTQRARCSLSGYEIPRAMIVTINVASCGIESCDCN